MILGWDIGGVNTKVAAVDLATGVCHGVSAPHEIRRDPGGLVAVLRRLAASFGPADAHAVTMTAELARVFGTKREGVGFVLDAIEEAVAGETVSVFTSDGRFVSPGEARAMPLAVGASNWAATAALVARTFPDCLLIDTGSTSTDIIPIVGGRIAVAGRTDPARLLSGELVYTGAVRTPAEALVRRVPLWQGEARVAAEGFAVTGDAHVWLGCLDPADYTAPTPDGRPADRECAGARLARLVCADREMLDEADIDAIARTIAGAQVAAVLEGIMQVRARHPLSVAVVAGLGDFIAAAAARADGLEVAHLADRLGAAARIAPAAAVATLLAELA
jgi:probable H4MPT-linked C1 transfer pathway protein